MNGLIPPMLAMNAHQIAHRSHGQAQLFRDFAIVLHRLEISMDYAQSLMRDELLPIQKFDDGQTRISTLRADSKTAFPPPPVSLVALLPVQISEALHVACTVPLKTVHDLQHKCCKCSYRHTPVLGESRKPGFPIRALQPCEQNIKAMCA